MQLQQIEAEARQLQPDEQRKLAATLLEGPSGRVRDVIWIIVISGFALVLVGAFITLAIGVFTKDIKPELILTMFTSVIGFLAGLFAPSPVSGK